MKIEEYEEFLSPKKEEIKSKEEIVPGPYVDLEPNWNWAREYQQEYVPAGPLIRTGITVGTNESFMSQHRSVSTARDTAALSREDHLDIMNAAINFINNKARNMRYNKDNISHLSREVRSFVATYFYRWFPYVRNPVVVCDTIPDPYEPHTEFRIVVDHIHIGTMGVNVHR